MTVVDRSVDELAHDARLIVHGTVVGIHPEAVPDRPRRTRSRVTIAVWEVLKPSGELVPEVVEIILPGGTRGRWTTVVPGVPQLAPGDEVVLMLVDTPWGLAPAGYGLGTWRVGPEGDAVRLLPVDDHPTPGAIPGLSPDDRAPLPALLDRLSGA